MKAVSKSLPSDPISFYFRICFYRLTFLLIMSDISLFICLSDKVFVCCKTWVNVTFLSVSVLLTLAKEYWALLQDMVHLSVNPTPWHHWDWINVLQQHKDLRKCNYFNEVCALQLTKSWGHLSLGFLIYRIRPWASFADFYPASSHGPLSSVPALPTSAGTGPVASWISVCSNTDVRMPTGLENIPCNPRGDIIRINKSRREKHVWKSFLLSSQQLLLSFV